MGFNSGFKGLIKLVFISSYFLISVVERQPKAFTVRQLVV